MPDCIVRGCPHTSRKRHANLAVTLHTFPKDIERIKQWLQQIGQDFGDLDAFAQRVLEGKKYNNYRICSAHFNADSYFTQGVSKFLRSDALPTIFAGRYGEKYTEGDCFPPPAKRFMDHDYAGEAMTYGHYTPVFSHDASTSTPAIFTKHISTRTDPYYGYKNASTRTDPYYRLVNASTRTDPKWGLKTAKTQTNVSCYNGQTSTSTDLWNMKNNVSTGIIKTIIMVDVGTSTDPIVSVADKAVQCPLDVDSSQPATHESNCYLGFSAIGYRNKSFAQVNSDVNLASDRKFIVFESCIDNLIYKMQCSFEGNCRAPIIRLEKKVYGTLLVVFGECQRGHKRRLWQSQPMCGKMPLGNLLSSAALLFSGNHFEKINEMYKLLGLQFITEKNYNRYQNIFLFPTIDIHWQRERQKNISNAKSLPLCVVSDGQCENPGFNAKYCTYTMMNAISKKILDFNVVRVTERTSTPAMEKLAFRRCLNKLLDEGLQVHIMNTDRHAGIKKVMRKEYKHISHEFDVWHYSKSIKKKLIAASQRKECKEINSWIPSIVNHLWVSCRASQGNVELLRETWESFLLHINNQHSWTNGKHIHECTHPTLSKRDLRTHPWLQKKTPAYNAVEQVMTDNKLRKEFSWLSKFCHTNEFEVFQGRLYKYRPRRVYFKMDAVEARTKLAVLAYNANINRIQAMVQPNETSTGSMGSLKYKLVFPQNKRKWQYRVLDESKSNTHVFSMMADVIKMSTGELPFR